VAGRVVVVLGCSAFFARRGALEHSSYFGLAGFRKPAFLGAMMVVLFVSGYIQVPFRNISY
jgi:hypothetical protein